jgi:preprotein translocase subunit YajC
MDLLFIAPQTEGDTGAVVENATPVADQSICQNAPATEQATSENAANTAGVENQNTETQTTEYTEQDGNQSTTDPAAAPQGGGYGFWIMIGAMILIMYFFMWRPEKKRRKQMEQFRQGIKKGDHVITAGGIYGTVKEVHETSILIESEGNTTLRIDKNMVVGDPSNGTAR